MSDLPAQELPMSLNKDIFAYGMAQLPVASSKVNPYNPYLRWSRETAHLEAVNATMSMQLLELDKLVRYVRAYGEYAKAWIRAYEEDEADDPDFTLVEATWFALSQELKDVISKGALGKDK